MAFYLGKRPQGDLILFRSSNIPNKETHGHLFTAVIGPFKSKVGAHYFARYGRDNPQLAHGRGGRTPGTRRPAHGAGHRRREPERGRTRHRPGM